MAKKEDSALSLLPPLDEITSTINLDKEDVLAVAVSAAEEHLEQCFKAAQARAAASRKQLSKLADEFTAAITAAAQEVYDPQYLADLVAALRVMIGPAFVTCSGSAAGSLENLGNQDRKDRRMRLAVAIHSGSAKNQGTTRFTHEEYVKLPLHLNTMVETAKELLQAAATADKEALAMRREMSKMSQYQRRAQAQLAVSHLSQTPEGRQFVEGMRRHMESRILGLQSEATVEE